METAPFVQISFPPPPLKRSYLRQRHCIRLGKHSVVYQQLGYSIKQYQSLT